MILRLAIVAVVAGGVAAAFWVGKRIVLNRSRAATEREGWGGVDFSAHRVTAVLFTGPNCAQCEVQRASIAQIRRERSDVGYAEFNAGIEVELAKRLKILSVPTTVVVDASGMVVARNGRLVDGSVLQRQIGAALATTT